MKEVRSCLSIDIDVFFDCHKYAKYMEYNIDPIKAWKMIDVLGVKYEPSIIAMNRVIDMLKEKCVNAEVVSIQEHDEIIEVLRDYECQEVTMYNVDNHHDITYGEDDTELNLENWVRHGKQDGLIGDYTWIHRPMSDIRLDSPFGFKRDCIEDISFDLIEEIDLVVICVSKHFTPPEYWNIIPKILKENIKESD